MDAQADLSLRYTHMSEGTLFHVVAYYICDFFSILMLQSIYFIPKNVRLFQTFKTI